MPLDEGHGERWSAGGAASGQVAVLTPGALSELLAQVARPEPDEVAWHRDAFPGQVVGRFELLRELGRGGFGVVFEARDRELGRLVAFKAVRPGTRASSAQRVEWLRREAEATAQLSHENIVALYDAGRTERGPYLVFELLEGETLAERLERGRLEPHEAIRVAVAVARALAYAHAAGVLHRDLKPSNVFLTARGQVKVLDFGLAHVFGWTGARGGTPAYMAPEQWRCEPEDGRTDVFALGVMLHEMLTGRPPFQVRDGRSEVLDPAVPPPALDGVPTALRPVVASALASAPEDRPRGAEALLERLLEAERSLSRPARARGSRRGMLAVAVAALAGAAVLATWRLSTRERFDGAAVPPAAPRAGSAPAGQPEAYEHYFRASDAFENGRWSDGFAELDRALAVDPEFALAHYLRAYAGEFGGNPASARADAEAALRRADQLPPKEQLLVRAWASHARGDDDAARRIYRDAVERFPRDPDVLYFAGDLLFHAGDLRGSAPLFRRALDARSGWFAPLEHLLVALETLGRREELVPTARRALAARANDWTYMALGMAYVGTGDLEAAIRELRTALTAGAGPMITNELGNALARASRLEEAEAVARKMVTLAEQPQWQLAGFELLAKVRALQGRRREEVRILDEIPASVRASDPDSNHLLATTVLAYTGVDPPRLWLEARSWGTAIAAINLAYAGDLPHAAELAHAVGGGADRDYYEGLVAWRRGDPAAAVPLLRAAARAGSWAEVAPIHLGEALADLGRCEESLDAFDRVRNAMNNRDVNAFAYPGTLLVAARCLERLGRRGEALRKVAELLRLWRGADADLPELAEARALRARLAAAGAPTAP